jgi:hypothetical protein
MSKKKNRRLNIVKVPLDYYPNNYPARFPPMPILYLELLENKDKVKKDIRTKDYVPPSDRTIEANIPTSDQAKDQEYKDIDKDFVIKDYSDEYPEKKGRREPLKILDLSEPKAESVNIDERDIEKKEDDEYRYEKNKRREEDDRYEKERRRDDDDNRREEKNNDDDDDRYEKERRRDDYDNRREEKNNDDDKIREKLLQRFSRLKDKYKNDDVDGVEPSHHSDSESEVVKKVESPKKEKNDEYKEYSDTQKKIFNLLKDDEEKREVKDEKRYEEKNEKRDERKEVQRPTDNLPPRFSELNNGVVRDNKGVRDITKGLTKQEDEEEIEKRMLLDKFNILKRKYKEAKIPEFNNYTDLSTMKRTYDSIVRQLQLDSTVDNYKRYLMLGFTATQFLVTKFLKVDMSGFAEQQILSINQYEKLLIEIGEKSYFKGPSQMSPELKLIGLIGFNAIIFVFSKMIFKVSGDNVLGSINKINDSAKPQQSAPKPHMRGPNFDDLKDIENLSRKPKNE